MQPNVESPDCPVAALELEAIVTPRQTFRCDWAHRAEHNPSLANAWVGKAVKHVGHEVDGNVSEPDGEDAALH